jgi:23S rRNA pseudouridine2605 synthase
MLQKMDTACRAPTRQNRMQERLQKIIGRAGIASRRHAEQLILSGQVRVNGVVVRELGTKADAATDKIVAAGRAVGVGTQRNIYLALHKPPEVVSAMADPEGRKTLRNCLRGLPERVFPVGNLEYATSGLVFLTNDGDLAAEMLKNWAQIEQVYHVKVKGMLTLADLDRIGKEVGLKMKTVRQPDATRGRAANFWYEVRMRDSKKDELRKLLMKEMHPVEKLMRIGLGSLTVEGLPRGRYRLLGPKEVEELRKSASAKKDVGLDEERRKTFTPSSQRAQRRERKTPR